MTLEFGKYYIVEVSYQDTNPIHRAIMCSYRKHEGGASVDLMSSGYEGVLSRNIEDLAYFRVIESIDAMNKPFKNRWRVPTEMGASKYRKQA